MAGQGDWLILEEMLERGDPSWVVRLRAFDGSDRLAKFGENWLRDRRPQSRKFLLEYLTRPLNAYRHEGLVKRLFKAAEKAQDDEVMAHFLTAFDRGIRRFWKTRRRWDVRNFKSDAEAKKFAAECLVRGATSANVHSHWGYHSVSATYQNEVLAMPRNTTVARPNKPIVRPAPEELLRLFSIRTRRYLQRRVWRYFRNLVKSAPDRYVPAACTALTLYVDADLPDGPALIDSWSLFHILFQKSGVADATHRGWKLKPGASLAGLAPSPAYPELWEKAADRILGLLLKARSHVVRHWALKFVEARPEILASAPIETLLTMLVIEDADVSRLAADTLERRGAFQSFTPARWLALIEKCPPSGLDIVCRLAEKHIDARRVSLVDAVRLAMQRPIPIARLGLAILRQLPSPSALELPSLLPLLDVPAEGLRPEMFAWLRNVLAASDDDSRRWVLEFLDCKHAAARAIGWKWLADGARLADAPELWCKLIESPFDDVQIRIVELLQKRFPSPSVVEALAADANRSRMRHVWAAVLVNCRRGGRAKSAAIRQLAERIQKAPAQASELLPVLAFSLRSIRGPEWRAGLAAVVSAGERVGELRKSVQSFFPELEYPEP